VMDQQWAGFSEGDAGRIDRGFGITRDVAAVMSQAVALAKSEYPGSTEPLADRVILAGTSMGGGIGGLGFLTMNDAGKIQLEGAAAELPKGMSAVLQSPFFGPSDTLQNKLFNVLGKTPGLKDRPLDPFEIGSFVDDDGARQKLVNRLNEENTQVRASALLASNDDLGTMRAELEAGHRPKGVVSILASKGDPIASFKASEAMVQLLGASARIEDQRGSNHINNEVPGKQLDLLRAIADVKAAQKKTAG